MKTIRLLAFASACIAAGVAAGYKLALLNEHNRIGASNAHQFPVKDGKSAIQRGLEDHIVASEKNYWTAWKNKEAKTLAQLRAEEFREVDGGGMTGKNEAERSERDLNILAFTIRNERVSILTPDVALLTYEVAYGASFKGKDVWSPQSYVSSMYQRRDNDWRLVYSQETPAAPH